MAVYQGADTMEAEKAQSMWSLFQGQKRHRGETQEQLDKREIGSNVGDILKKMFPGWGHVADVGIEQFGQKAFKIPEYEEPGGFWTAKKAKKYRDEAEDIREGADFSLLESIFKTGKEYIGSEAGSEVAGNFGDFFKKMFSGDEYIPYHGGGEFSPDLLSKFASNGGRVPKYENGGEVSSIGWEELMAQMSYQQGLQEQSREKGSEYLKDEAGAYRKLLKHDKQDWYPGKMIEGLLLKKKMKDYGKLLHGEKQEGLEARIMGETLQDVSRSLSEYSGDFDIKDVLSRMKDRGYPGKDAHNPRMKKYAGGGSVSGDSPTIAGYFSQQGKTLGGSNTQSLAEKLGRK